jgi:glutathione peroxidase
MHKRLLVLACTFATLLAAVASPASAQVLGEGRSRHECAHWLNQVIGKLHSDETIDLCAETAGKAVLLVNTASYCGYTPQFKGLEALYQRYRKQGLTIIGFPSDDFFQESDDAATTATVCYVNYGVTFPMTAAIKVRGGDAHPIFKHLHQAGQPSWNFNKYLVGADGRVIAHFGSNTEPDDVELTSAIEKELLASKAK